MRQPHHSLKIAVLLFLTLSVPPASALAADAGASVAAVSAQALPSWGVRLDFLRGLAGLPALPEDSSLSAGCLLHARYMAENRWIGHTEDPANAWYTPQGALAASRSNAYLGRGGLDAIDGWMRTPFHALGMLDPRLLRTGFGTYVSSQGVTAATLDVLSARWPLGSITLTSPILWPGDGATVPFTTAATGEWPDPLAGTGYSPPVGLVVIAQFGTGANDPVVSGSSLVQDGVALEHAVYTERTYANSDAEEERLGRGVLGSRDAVFLIPRDPLEKGATYEVSLAVNGRRHDWSFRTKGGVPTTIRLTPSAKSCAYAQHVTLSARLTSENGGVSGQRVVFERLAGSSYVTLGTASTGADGTCSVIVRPKARLVARARFAGAGELESASSAPKVVLPRASLTTPYAPSGVRRGSRFTVTGYIRPHHRAGDHAVRLHIYRLEAGRWVLRGKLSTTNIGLASVTRYARTLALPAGRYRIRAFHEDGDHARTYSGWRYVYVR